MPQWNPSTYSFISVFYVSHSPTFFFLEGHPIDKCRSIWHSTSDMHCAECEEWKINLRSKWKNNMEFNLLLLNVIYASFFFRHLIVGASLAPFFLYKLSGFGNIFRTFVYLLVVKIIELCMFFSRELENAENTNKTKTKRQIIIACKYHLKLKSGVEEVQHRRRQRQR